MNFVLFTLAIYIVVLVKSKQCTFSQYKQNKKDTILFEHWKMGIPSVADPKLSISDPNPIRKVITDLDTDPTCQVIRYPDLTLKVVLDPVLDPISI